MGPPSPGAFGAGSGRRRTIVVAVLVTVATLATGVPFGHAPTSHAGRGPAVPLDAGRSLTGPLPPTAVRATPHLPPYSHTLASQADEYGTVSAVVPAGPSPYFPGFDPANGYVYVPNLASDTVTVINGSTDVGNVTVPGGPTAGPYTAAYDPTNGEMYVTVDAAGYVTVINGTSAVRNISVPNNPIPVAYDPENGYMYVGEEGGGTAAVLNGTGVVTTVPLAGSPRGAAFDPANGWMYFADDSSLTILNGTHVVGNISVSGTGYGPGIAYDPVNREMYVADDLGNTVQCLNGTSTVGSFPLTTPGSIVFDTATSALYIERLSDVGGQYITTVGVVSGTTPVANLLVNDGNVSPGVHGLAYDSRSATVYVAAGPQNVSVLSTVLALDPVNVTPSGDPTRSADVGQSRNFSAELWAVGNGTLTPSIAVSPRNEWTCGSLGWNSSPLGPDRLQVACAPGFAGTFAVWANVTDASGTTVSAEVTMTVFADPTVGPLQPEVNGRVVTGADANAVFDLWVNVTGGSGNLSYGVEWSPSPDGICVNFLSNHFQCAFAVLEVIDLQAYLSDGNGESAYTAVAPFSIVSDVTAGALVAVPPSADAGQPVELQAVASGGTGAYDSFLWSGLPAGGCQGISTAAPVCVFPTPGIYPLQVVIGDSGGGVSTSSTLNFSVAPTLEVPTLMVNRSAVDVGQAVAFSAAASGGRPPYAFAWEGLPVGCPTAPTGLRVNCTPSAPGLAGVQVTVTDANGRSFRSNLSALTVFATLVLGTPVATPSGGGVGSRLSIVAVVEGGAPAMTYQWSGLPPGCASTTATVSCTPTVAGAYSVQLRATDANGVRAVSPALHLSVTAAPPTTGSGGARLSTAALAAIAAGAVGIAVGVWTYRRRRSR